MFRVRFARPARVHSDPGAPRDSGPRSGRGIRLTSGWRGHLGRGSCGGLVALLLLCALAACVDAVAPSPAPQPRRELGLCNTDGVCLEPGAGACTTASPDCLCDPGGAYCCLRDAFCARAPGPASDALAPQVRILWARGPNVEGSFTTLAGERTLAFAAEAVPAPLAPSVTWSVVDDPGDAVRAVAPSGSAPAGTSSSLDVSRQTTERWRLPHGAPLSARALAFRVVAELPASGGRRAARDSIVVRQREVDVLRQEYADFGIVVPSARDVVTPADVAGRTRFAWSQLNQGDYGVAVITPVLLAGLEAVSAQSDQPLALTSVFRNPAHHRFHINVSGGSAKALLSQHQYGTAVDIRTHRNLDTWHRLRNIAKSAGACAEPLTISTSDHVHADWRTGAPICPKGW